MVLLIWGCESFIPILCGGLGIVAYDIMFVWCFLGDAIFSLGTFNELAREVWEERQWGTMVSGFIVSHVVSLTRTECEVLWGPRAQHVEVEVLILSLYRSWHCAHCPLQLSPWNQNPVKQCLKILPPQFQNSLLITSHHVGLIFSLTAVDKMSCMMPQDHSDVYADKLLVRSYVLSKG